MLKLLLEALNARYEDFRFAPALQFVNLQSLNYIEIPGQRSPQFVVYLTVTPPAGGSINVPEGELGTLELALGKMHFMQAVGIQVGYLFELPRWPCRVYDNHFKVLHPNSMDKTSFPGLTYPYADDHIVVATTKQGDALLVLDKRKRYVDIQK